MLADHDAIREIFGTNMTAQSLGLCDRTILVERYTNPKNKLNEMIRRINANRPRRRQQIDLNTRYEPLARLINLNILSNVPSYRQFVDDFTQTLRKLHFIPPEPITERWNY